MPENISPSTEAVVICTRNRPSELARTLESVASQNHASLRRVIVVDGSSSHAAEETARVALDAQSDLPLHYHVHSGDPSSAEQRNIALELLSNDIRVVHFLDDDVTLQHGYFEALCSEFRNRPNVGGAGGLIVEPSFSTDAWIISLLKHLFLLTHPKKAMCSYLEPPVQLKSSRKTQNPTFLMD